MTVCYSCVELRRKIAELRALTAQLQAQIDDLTPCEHKWELHEDEEGDPREAHLWADCSQWECVHCGASRAVTDADRQRMREEAQS